jgi:hypothetical protein
MGHRRAQIGVQATGMSCIRRILVTISSETPLALTKIFCCFPRFLEANDTEPR